MQNRERQLRSFVGKVSLSFQVRELLPQPAMAELVLSSDKAEQFLNETVSVVVNLSDFLYKNPIVSMRGPTMATEEERETLLPGVEEKISKIFGLDVTATMSVFGRLQGPDNESIVDDKFQRIILIDKIIKNRRSALPISGKMQHLKIIEREVSIYQQWVSVQRLIDKLNEVNHNLTLTPSVTNVRPTSSSMECLATISVFLGTISEKSFGIRINSTHSKCCFLVCRNSKILEFPVETGQSGSYYKTISQFLRLLEFSDVEPFDFSNQYFHELSMTNYSTIQVNPRLPVEIIEEVPDFVERVLSLKKGIDKKRFITNPWPKSWLT